MEKCYKQTWTDYLCGRSGGTWCSTPLSARVITAMYIINTVYILHGQVLEVVTSAKYLGVDICNGL